MVGGPDSGRGQSELREDAWQVAVVADGAETRGDRRGVGAQRRASRGVRECGDRVSGPAVGSLGGGEAPRIDRQSRTHGSFYLVTVSVYAPVAPEETVLAMIR